MTMTTPNRVAAGVPTGGQFAASARAEASVALAEPAPQIVEEQPVYNSMADLEAAGYVTDEWGRWQQGYCAAYAVALVDAHPHLRFAVMGRTELGNGDASEGWSETHAFAHDDHYAYDSAGRHPLPYHDVRGQSDYVELDQDPEDWGYRDEFLDSDFADAIAHANRHAILTRQPVPLGGLKRADGFVKPAPPLAGERHPEATVSIHDIAWDDFGAYDPDDETDPPGDETVETIEHLADLLTSGVRLDPIEVKPAPSGSPRRFDLHDGWHRIQAARQVGIAHLDVVVITPEEPR